jgi:hypothetical protein
LGDSLLRKDRAAKKFRLQADRKSVFCISIAVDKERIDSLTKDFVDSL